MIFDIVNLTLKVDLLFKKIDQDYEFWIRGVTYCCYLHMVAAGELCCLSDNSGYAPGLKGPGASSNRIVCLFVRLSVRNSIPLTNKVQYLKFGRWYSNRTWTVSSSKGCSHLTDITCPWGGAWSKCRTLPYFEFVAAGGIRVSQTRV